MRSHENKEPVSKSLPMQEKKEQLASRVVDSVNQGIMITDTNGSIEYVNPFFIKITGYNEQDLIGNNPRILKSGEHPQSFYKKMWSSLINRGTWQGEIWNKAKDGTIIPEWLSISTIYDEQKKPLYYVASFSDLTRHKRAQIEKGIQSDNNFYAESPSSASLAAPKKQRALLKEKDKKVFSELVEDFQEILEYSLEEQSYSTGQKKVSITHQLAQKAAEFAAGPRDIIEIYSQALKQKTQNQNSPKAQFWREEGRILLIELLGHLVSVYQQMAFAQSESSAGEFEG